MNRVWICLVAAAAISFTLAAVADQGESSLKIEDTKEKNKIPDADQIDDLITNNNLRAYSGSTSRWSIASTFNYNGGTMQTPLSQDRPNISQSSGTTTKSDLDGAISTKYNIDVKNSLMAGIGIRWIAPLQKGGPSNYDGTTFDVMNPYLQYQYLYKWVGIQSVLQVENMVWTQADQTAVGYLNQLNVDQENMYEVGHTGISLGASVSGQYQWFDKSGAYSTPNSPNYIPNVATKQSEYSLSFAPELEYQLNSKFNLRTLVSIWTYEHYASQSNATTFTHDKVYGSIGVGYAMTRDIFLYPNIQFLPDQITSKYTNVGVTATINVF